LEEERALNCSVSTTQHKQKIKQNFTTTTKQQKKVVVGSVRFWEKKKAFFASKNYWCMYLYRKRETLMK
jgi:hypothetical protein